MLRILKWWQARGDRRRDFRHHVRRLAFIDLDNGVARRGCTIHDISESGARLIVAAGNELPEEFTLLVPRRCRIVRRSNGQVGVRFVDGN
jgi:PilZ domain